MKPPNKLLKRRTLSVVSIPREKNLIYGDDVPMPWEEAARQVGIPKRTFRRLIDRREITALNLPGRLVVRPSAVREYLMSREAKRI